VIDLLIKGREILGTIGDQRRRYPKAEEPREV
jgi:hypothetical protein